MPEAFNDGRSLPHFQLPTQQRHLMPLWDQLGRQPRSHSASLKKKYQGNIPSPVKGHFFLELEILICDKYTSCLSVYQNVRPHRQLALKSHLDILRVEKWVRADKRCDQILLMQRRYRNVIQHGPADVQKLWTSYACIPPYYLKIKS